VQFGFRAGPVEKEILSLRLKDGSAQDDITAELHLY